MATSPFIAGRRRALQAAAELLGELDVDQERPVDVFDVIERLGLWLVFQPLKSLLGAVVPQGPGGVMITTEREPTIQRYTAAHEIGHWQLDQNPTAFDTETDIFNLSANECERQAQWFAAYFLMPPPLVHATVTRHLAPADAMSPATAYLIARDMRVSYEAALRQMANLDIVTERECGDLLAVPRLAAIRDAAHGHRPRDGRADVWLLDDRSLQHSSEQVDMVVNDEVVIMLPENRTTGYRWLDEAANASRRNLAARPAPPPLMPPSVSPAEPARSEPPRRSTADINAALARLPRRRKDNTTAAVAPTTSDQPYTGLPTVTDEYRPGWARILSRDPGQIRRHVAGMPGEPTDLLAAAGSRLPDPVNPGVGATGVRILALQARAEGHFTNVLCYAPVHDPHVSPATTFTIAANVSPPPDVLHRRALLDIDLDSADDQPTTTTDEGNQ